MVLYQRRVNSGISFVFWQSSTVFSTFFGTHSRSLINGTLLMGVLKSKAYNVKKEAVANKSKQYIFFTYLSID